MNRNIPIGGSIMFVKYKRNGTEKYVQIKHVGHNLWIYVIDFNRQTPMPAHYVTMFYNRLINNGYIPMPGTPRRNS